jgi:hypothetical protein
MVAGYLRSTFEKEVLSTIADIDRTAVDYYVKSPLLINCRGDATAFNAQVTATQRSWIVKDFASGRLTSVTGLTRPSYSYAQAQLRQRHGLLSNDGREVLDAFLKEWQIELDRNGDQLSKLDAQTSHAGIDIILPTGTRLPYDWINLRGL